MNKKNEMIEDNQEIVNIDKVKEKKRFVVLETTNLFCNKVFNLVKGEYLPDDFPEAFIQSLLNSNTIK